MANPPSLAVSNALDGVPVLSKLVIPKVTVASLAVYSVMGGLGGTLWSYGPSKGLRGLGEGLTIAAFVGAGYALSHAIVANVAPNAIADVDVSPLKEP